MNIQNNCKTNQKPSQEDFASFDNLLLKVYTEKRIEECYQILRQLIRRLFLQKNTNSRYRSAFENDFEDLTESVIARYRSFDWRSSKTIEQKVADFEKTLRAIIRRVYLEKLRTLRRVTMISIADLSHELLQLRNNETEGIIDEIRLECYYECLKNLPERIAKLFVRYYPNYRVTPQDLAAMRVAIAGETSNEASSQSRSAENEHRSLNNLQKKIHQWRTNELAGCVMQCVEGRIATSIELNYLEQQ